MNMYDSTPAACIEVMYVVAKLGVWGFGGCTARRWRGGLAGDAAVGVHGVQWAVVTA